MKINFYKLFFLLTLTTLTVHGQTTETLAVKRPESIVIMTNDPPTINCKIEKLTSYGDTLHVIQDYTFHLFCNAKLNFKNKLNSLYTDYSNNQRADTCYLFLIPDSKAEFASDGDFVSQYVHKSTLNKQKEVRWIEIVQLVQVKNFYLFTITTNKSINGKKSILQKFDYKVSCQRKNIYYKYRRKLL